MNGFLSFNEIMIYKVMAIYYWNQICNLDESFWAQFILFFNFGLTFVTHFSRWMLNSFEDERNGFAAGSGIYDLVQKVQRELEINLVRHLHKILAERKIWQSLAFSLHISQTLGYDSLQGFSSEVLLLQE